MTSGKPLPLIVSFAIPLKLFYDNLYRAALILPIFIGETGIFLAEVAAWIGAAVYLILYYYKEIAKIKKLLGTKEGEV